MFNPPWIFSMGSSLALLCWLGLALSVFVPVMRAWTWRITGAVVPVLLAIVYIVLIRQGFRQAQGGGFGSIAEVRALFASDSGLTAGWLHYLAFDLFVGTWIAQSSASEQLHPLLTLVCLPLAFMFGPAGLLLYLMLRFISGRLWRVG